MTRRLILNAMSMNTVSHTFHGSWRDPSSRQVSFGDLDFWTHFARTAERGKLDAIFLADVVGVGETYRGGSEVFLREGVQIPANDPMVLCAALIGLTEHLGFAFTSSILQQHPFQFARQISTFDHLSKGRVGWNIVTSALENASRNFGLPGLTPHDERYRWADEYVEVVYKLWEGSWEDGAVVRDAEAGIYADPTLVHAIDHAGERYRVQGPHLAEPSPQRTPLLYQAGHSETGRAYASRNAEVMFIVSPTPEVARDIVTDVRSRAAALGRSPDDIRFVVCLSFVVGSTEEEARRKAADLGAYLSTDGLLAHISRDVGIDFGDLEPETPLAEVKTEAIQSIVQVLLDGARGDEMPCVADLARYLSGQNRLVGTPGQIADQLEAWQAAGVDGVNILFTTLPGSLEEFVDHVVPELQARGLAQREYAPGTLREKIFGKGPRLPASHPGAAHRRTPEGTRPHPRAALRTDERTP